MREIMDYLEHNYMNKIQMKDIAEEIHLCESECSRLFKRYMNVSLFTFLQEYRVERSLEFLLSSDDSIMEVAQKSGFTDSNYYAKVFSRVKAAAAEIQEAEYTERYVRLYTGYITPQKQYSAPDISSVTRHTDSPPC